MFRRDVKSSDVVVEGVRLPPFKVHNLFGDTNVVSVRVTCEGKLEFVHELKGDSIRDVLSYVEYQTDELFSQFEKRTDTALSDGKISIAQRGEILNLFSESLRGYTYFEQ